MSELCCHRGVTPPAEGFAPPDAPAHYPPDLQLEPTHLELDLRVDVEAKRLDAVVTMRLHANVEQADRLRLDAVGLVVERVSSLDDEVSHTHAGEKLQIAFASPFRRGEERTIRIAYHVVDPIAGLYFHGPSPAEPDARLLAITDHETERARYWLPCVDSPSVRPTLAFHIRAAERFTILANGALEGEDSHDDGTKTVHYRLDRPCPSYLTCFAVGELVRWQGEPVSGVPIACYATSTYTPRDLERTFGRTGKMLAFMNDRLGVTYPFPKYAQLVAPGIGGAMENISLVTWDDRFMLDEELETEERWLVDIVNVHEMAHAWFGDHVVCRDYAHAWLKEGWATYMEVVWREHDEGPDGAAHELFTQAREYFHEVDAAYRRPIVTRRFQSSFDMYDRHLYPGGSWRLHMLRQELGDAVFWDGVRIYLERFGGKVVETEDFRRVLEERSGRSLGRFFDQWLHSPGYPKLEVKFEHDAAKKVGTFEVRQKQVDEKNGSPYFVFDLEIGFEAENGHVERRRVHVDRAHAVFGVPMPTDPAFVRIDPGGKLLASIDFDPGAPRLTRQLRAGDALGRMQAGWAIAKAARRPGVAAMRAAFHDEGFWGVRVEWAEALGEHRSEAALEALLDWAAKSKEPKSLPAVIRALGAYRDPRVVETLEKRLDGSLGPRAREAALVALGAQREYAPVDRLVAAARRPDFSGFVQSGALRALASTRRTEVLDHLVERSVPAAAVPRVRATAALAIGALYRALEHRARERALERLVDLLRDPERRVRAAAAQAIVDANAGEAIGSIEAYRASLPPQDQSRLDRLLRRLRADAPNPVKALEKELETFREKIRTLEDRLEKLEGTVTKPDA